MRISSFVVFAVILSFGYRVDDVSARACRPITLLMTRASGSSATMKDGVFQPKYPLNGVNLANINGALKYVMTETIDLHTGVTNTSEGCHRKNWVQYIHFYQVSFCNPDKALWWFNPSRPSGYFNQLGDDFKEFGAYLTFDGGQCHSLDNCDLLHGKDDYPALGPWVGFQRQSSDERNPTKDAYWFSIPGDCPMKGWSGADKKDAECMKKYSSGRCAKDEDEFDGKDCIWKTKFLGQVNLDHLSRITSEKNPATGKTFKDYEEFCKAGRVEFERDSHDYSFIRGLPFYKDPLSPAKNKERIDELLIHYQDKDLYPNNIPLPADFANGPCHESVRKCGDGTFNTYRCRRDDSGVCVYCESRSDHDECIKPLPSNWLSRRFPELPPVRVAGEELDTDGGDASEKDKDERDDHGWKGTGHEDRDRMEDGDIYDKDNYGHQLNPLSFFTTALVLSFALFLSL